MSQNAEIPEETWCALRRGFMTKREFDTAAENGEMAKPGTWFDDLRFQNEHPNHPLAMKNRGARMSAADTIARCSEPFAEEDLERIHQHLFDCCAAVRLSLAKALMRCGDHRSIPYLEDLKSEEDESKAVASLAEIALIKIKTPDRFMENGSMIYVGDIADGLPNGQGRLFYSGTLKLIYEGGFRDGRFHGRGTRVNDDRSISRGEFVDGQFVG